MKKKQVDDVDIEVDDVVVDDQEQVIDVEDDAVDGSKKNDDGSETFDVTEEDEPGTDDVVAWKRKHNEANARLRKSNERLKEIEEENKRLKTTPVVQQQPARDPALDNGRQYWNGVAVPRTKEEWDALAKKDWQTAVDMRSVMNAQQLMQTDTKAKEDTKVLTESKQRVLSRHPELNDINSDKSKIYLNILEQNPQYKADPKGPVHAMRDMEEYMEEVLGMPRESIAAARSKGAQDEQARTNRVVVSNSNKGRFVNTNSKQVTLSRDDLDFCKHNGIDPKEFARNKVKLSHSKGGIQL